MFRFLAFAFLTIGFLGGVSVYALTEQPDFGPNGPPFYQQHTLMEAAICGAYALSLLLLFREETADQIAQWRGARQLRSHRRGQGSERPRRAFEVILPGERGASRAPPARRELKWAPPRKR